MALSLSLLNFIFYFYFFIHISYNLQKCTAQLSRHDVNTYAFDLQTPVYYLMNLTSFADVGLLTL